MSLFSGNRNPVVTCQVRSNFYLIEAGGDQQPIYCSTLPSADLQHQPPSWP